MAVVVCGLLGMIILQVHKASSLTQREVATTMNPLQSSPSANTSSKPELVSNTNNIPSSVKALSSRVSRIPEPTMETCKDENSHGDLTKGAQMNVDKDWGIEFKVDSRAASNYSEREEASKDRLETVGPSVTIQRKF
jgi:hypothetical protein